MSSCYWRIPPHASTRIELKIQPYPLPDLWLPITWVAKKLYTFFIAFVRSVIVTRTSTQPYITSKLELQAEQKAINTKYFMEPFNKRNLTSNRKRRCSNITNQEKIKRGYDQHLICHPYELFFNGVMNKQQTVTRGYDQCTCCNP